MDISHLLDKWERDGIISHEQKMEMKADHLIAHRGHRSSKFAVIVSVLGAILLGLGAILFFASNWETLGRGFKFILILLLPIIPLAGGYWLSEHKGDYPILGKSLTFLGTLLIGASIALFFQLYNLDLNPALIFLLWLIFSTPFVFLAHFPASGALHTILLLLWFNFQFIFVDNGWWWFEPDEETFVLIELILGAVLLGAGNLIQYKTKGYESIHGSYRGLGLWIVLSCGFIFTTGIYTQEVLELHGGYRFLFNVLYIVLLAGVILAGVYKKVNFVITQAFIWVGIYLLSVYFDFFWGLMERSLALMGLGLLALLGGFYLERYRRRLITTLHEK